MLLSSLGEGGSEKGCCDIYTLMTKNASLTFTHTFVESGFMKKAPDLGACHENMGTPDVHTDTGHAH